jgi:hypothetical protein
MRNYAEDGVDECCMMGESYAQMVLVDVSSMIVLASLLDQH